MVWRDRTRLTRFGVTFVIRALIFAAIVLDFFALTYLIVFFTGAFTGNEVGVSWWQAFVAGGVLTGTVALGLAYRRRHGARTLSAVPDPNLRDTKRDDYYRAAIKEPVSIPRGVVGFTDTVIRFGTDEPGHARWHSEVRISDIVELSRREFSGDVRGRLGEGEELFFTVQVQMTPMKDSRASEAIEAVIAKVQSNGSAIEAEDEIGEILVGGVNSVKRVGNTVIRPAGPHTRSVHALLRFVRENGFTGCPEVIGLDEELGTETLTFLPGEITNYPVSDPFGTDRALATAAQLLRRFHDASVGFDHDEYGNWSLPSVQPTEVMCHGDFAPYNCVVRGGEVVGVFDFDTAHPGPRLSDVGYAAYRWVPLDPLSQHEEADIAEQQRRLALFCASYGVSDVKSVLAAATTRIAALVGYMRSQAEAGHPEFTRHIREGHVDVYLSAMEHIEGNEHALLSP